MNIKSIAFLAAMAALSQTPSLAQTLPSYDVTANGTGGTFMGTLVIAEETYAWMKTDGRLGGYGKLKLLSFDTHLPNFALLSGPLKDEFGAGGGGMAGPRDNFEDISGELFMLVAVAPKREDNWYCTGRHKPEGLM